MILERIRLAYPSLTKSQKRLADFMASHYQEAAFMTASRMAQAMSMNQATVIRFAQRLGYEGFPEMVADVQDLVHQELQSKGETTTPVAAFEATGTRLAENLGQLFSHITAEASAAAVQMLAEAETICIVGEGISRALAQLFVNQLRLLGKRAFCLEASSHELAVALQSVLADALLVAISFDHPNREMSQALRVARQEGHPTLALAWSPLDPCAQAADVALICPLQVNETLPSVTAFCLMLDTLAQLLVQRDHTEATLAQQRVRRFGQQMRNP